MTVMRSMPTASMILMTFRRGGVVGFSLILSETQQSSTFSNPHNKRPHSFERSPLLLYSKLALAFTLLDQSRTSPFSTA